MEERSESGQYKPIRKNFRTVQEIENDKNFSEYEKAIERMERKGRLNGW